MKTSKPNLYLLMAIIICMSMIAPVIASAAPAITSPASGSTLSGSSETFNWTSNGTAVSAWWLWAGPCNNATFGGCGDDYYNSGQLGSGTLSATVSGLPTDGSTVYIRLWYNSGGWQSVLFQYTAYSGNIPEIYNPSPGATLTGSTVIFSWRANGVPVNAWGLDVGSSQGSSDYFIDGGVFNPDNDQLTSMEVTGLPCDGSTVYVRLWYNTGSWLSMDYQYTASSSCTATDPEITSPTTGSELICGDNVFTWQTNGTVVSSWWLWVGLCNDSTIGGCGDDYYSSGQLGSGTLSTAVTGLPTDGSTVYVRLWYNAGGWQSVVYEYQSCSPVVVACPCLDSEDVILSPCYRSEECYKWEIIEDYCCTVESGDRETRRMGEYILNGGRGWEYEIGKHWQFIGDVYVFTCAMKYCAEGYCDGEEPWDEVVEMEISAEEELVYADMDRE